MCLNDCSQHIGQIVCRTTGNRIRVFLPRKCRLRMLHCSGVDAPLLVWEGASSMIMSS
jgi:hypothetical protein